MIKNLKQRLIQEMKKPFTETSEIAFAFTVTAAIATGFALMFGLIFLLDAFDSFVKWLFK